jgi:4-aminobutyrate aminotransferase/(S)-3-amino-2-methylpropionate transaminase
MAPIVRTELPGPRAREEMARGTFDMQSRYRAFVMDDAASQGTAIVDVDGNVFLDLFASFALGALGYNHPALLEVARSPAFARAAANPTSTPFVTTPRGSTSCRRWSALRAAADGAGVLRRRGGEGVEAALKAAFIVHGERRRVAAGQPANPLLLPEAELQAPVCTTTAPTR